MEEGNDIFTPRGLEEALARRDRRDMLRKKIEEKEEEAETKSSEEEQR